MAAPPTTIDQQVAELRNELARAKRRARHISHILEAEVRNIEAALTSATAATAAAAIPAFDRRGNLTIIRENWLMVWRTSEVQLSRLEFDFIDFLSARRGSVKKRADFLDRFFPSDSVRDRIVDEHFNRARKKFRAVDDEFDQIEALYGIGYRWRAEPKDAALRLQAPSRLRLPAPLKLLADRREDLKQTRGAI